MKVELIKIMEYFEHISTMTTNHHLLNHHRIFIDEQNQQTRKRRKSSRIKFEPLVLVSLLLLVLLSLVQISVASLPCKQNEYWDSKLDSCIKCSKCDEQMIVIRPCQSHRDTTCGTINDLDIDWSWFKKMENNKEHLQDQQANALGSNLSAASSSNDEELLWDWQIVSLVMATAACLLFFIATGIIFYNYVRQWRRIDKHFDADIEELSAQLMAKLANVPNIENGPILLDDPTTKNHRHGPRQIEVRCVFLQELLGGKDALKNSEEHNNRIMAKSGTGNVYIEENANDHQRPHKIV